VGRKRILFGCKVGKLKIFFSNENNKIITKINLKRKPTKNYNKNCKNLSNLQKSSQNYSKTSSLDRNNSFEAKEEKFPPSSCILFLFNPAWCIFMTRQPEQK
jgi:hypothetical protein